MHKLSKIKKNRFTYHDILEVWPDLNYESLAELVEQLIIEEKITPIKKSGKTSFRPPIYYEYKKLREKKDYSIFEPEIRGLHPRLNIAGYLKNPQLYQEHRERVQVLSQHLWSSKTNIEKKMSVNEKSYAIWQDEKYLDSASGRKLLHYNQITSKELGFYPAPEPFFTSICSRDFTNMDVLVLENKDPWYSLAKAFKETGTCRICGHSFGLLIYGEGNKVTRPDALLSYLSDLTGN